MADEKKTNGQTPGTDVTKPDPRWTSMSGMLVKMTKQFQLAIPKNLTLDAERLVRVALTSIQRNPDLLDCDPRTMLAAVMECAQLGIVPDGILGHCYLVPYNNTQKRRQEVQFLMGYKGYIELGHRSGKIDAIDGFAVYEKDSYDVELGTHPLVRHTPYGGDDPGPLVAAYGLVRMKGGIPHFRWLWPRDIARSRKASKTADKSWSPWQTHPEAMWIKTAIRMTAKFIRLSPEMQRAVALDERADEGLAQHLGDDDAIDITPMSTLQRGASDSIERMKAADAERLKAEKETKPETPAPPAPPKDSGDAGGGVMD